MSNRRGLINKQQLPGSDHGMFLMEGLNERKLRPVINDRACNSVHYDLEDIIGESPALKRAMKQVMAAGKNNVHVLLQGESGTGKEVFAQSIHQLSKSAEDPFVAINCGALPRSLAESELFGYEGGTFTGADRRGRPGKLELAHGGTLFLDEIGDMPLSMQPLLLRVLEEKRVMRLGSDRYIPLNFRVVAASNQDLGLMVNHKMFREDLYYRLSAFKITLPPLRQRGEDIVLLAQYFIDRACCSMDVDRMAISPEAIEAIRFYAWPGNIRQLENSMIYAAAMACDGIIGVEDLPEEIWCRSDEEQADNNQIVTMRESEKRAIKRAMNYAGNSVVRAAELLEISKSTLYRKIKEYEIGDI